MNLPPEMMYLAQLDAMRNETMAGDGFTGSGVHSYITPEQQQEAQEAEDREFYMMYLQELQKEIDANRETDPDAAEYMQGQLDETRKRLGIQDQIEQQMKSVFERPSNMPPGDGVPHFEGFK